MSKAVSRGQALEVSARVCTQVDWGALDGDALQKDVIQLSPEEFGKRFTDFIKNGAKVVVIFFSTILSLAGIVFDPKVIGKGWSVWKGSVDGDGLEGKEAQDVRALAMTELDAAKMQFETCLVDGEKSITGEEKFKRLLALGQPLAGGRQFLALWRDYQANKEKSVLEWLRQERGITYLDFFGTMLRDSDGHRYVLSLYWDGGEWFWNYRWLGNAWLARDPSAVLVS